MNVSNIYIVVVIYTYYYRIESMRKKGENEQFWSKEETDRDKISFNFT